MLEILIGTISGTITGLGMGGGTILILLLSTFMGLNQHASQATNLIFFVPTSLAAIVTNLRQKNINVKLGVFISSFGIIGAIIGAIISQKIDSGNLRKYFAIFILFIAFNEIYQLYKEYRNNRKKT